MQNWSTGGLKKARASEGECPCLFDLNSPGERGRVSSSRRIARQECPCARGDNAVFLPESGCARLRVCVRPVPLKWVFEKRNLRHLLPGDGRLIRPGSPAGLSVARWHCVRREEMQRLR